VIAISTPKAVPLKMRFMVSTVSEWSRRSVARRLGFYMDEARAKRYRA
jgi:hypothetical protein